METDRTDISRTTTPGWLTSTFAHLTPWRALTLLSILLMTVAFLLRYEPGMVFDFFRQGKPFDRFVLVLVMIVILPPLAERLQLPGLLGLIAGGFLIGPHGLALAPKVGEVAHFFSEVGRVFLMFVVGMEISLRDFRRHGRASTLFGLTTFTAPMLGGFALGQAAGFSMNASVLIGSILASHTLLGYPILEKLGLVRAPFALTTIGATIFTDIASLLVLAVCLSVHESGILSWYGLGRLVFQVAVYCVVVLGAIPWLGGAYLATRRDDEAAQFQFVLAVLIICAVGAKMIGLEDIVGAFLCGIAINQVLRHGRVRDKLEFLGKNMFIPGFLLVIGAEFNLPLFVRSLSEGLPFVLGMLGALFAGKFVAAWVSAWLCHYGRFEGLSMWALSLPQLAATLAATITAYQSMNSAGERLIEEDVVNAVIVLVVVTATVGPILTERFGRKLQQSPASPAAASA
jgi:Kef-type K+ transport system membrane component KefB